MILLVLSYYRNDPFELFKVIGGLVIIAFLFFVISWFIGLTKKTIDLGKEVDKESDGCLSAVVVIGVLYLIGHLLFAK